MFGKRLHHTHIGRLIGRLRPLAVKVLPRRVQVQGSSMIPTFLPGDRLVLIPPFKMRPGCVVAIADPRMADRLMIKRVARLDSRTVEVLGDNPDASTDSRHFGPIDRQAIVGRVLLRYGPPDRAGWWPQ
jgi:nickel-type superoxide dismutase maturation protease